MAWRWTYRKKLFSGVWLNLSKRGASVSMREGPFTVNVAKDGVHTTAGLHGTGLSWRESYKWGKRSLTPEQVERRVMGFRLLLILVLIVLATVAVVTGVS